MQGSNLPQPTDSMVGKLLVASSSVNDPVLSRSVCLVVHQDLENIFAVLLNRPMATPPGMAKMFFGGADAIDQTESTAPSRFNDPSDEQPVDPEPFGADASTSSLPAEVSPPPSSSEIAAQNAAHTAAEAAKVLGGVHFGGPLAGPIVAVHDSSEHAEAVAGKGVYLAAQRDLLESLMKDRPRSMRLIVGHLGWSVEQLRAEEQSGYWHIIDATDDDVFTDDQDLWPSVIRRATSSSVAKWVGITDQPFSAEVN